MDSLRAKVEANKRLPVHLLTVHGQGYRFVPRAGPRPGGGGDRFVGRAVERAALRAAIDTARTRHAARARGSGQDPPRLGGSGRDQRGADLRSHVLSNRGGRARRHRSDARDHDPERGRALPQRTPRAHPRGRWCVAGARQRGARRGRGPCNRARPRDPSAGGGDESGASRSGPGAGDRGRLVTVGRRGRPVPRPGRAVGGRRRRDRRGGRPGGPSPAGDRARRSPRPDDVCGGPRPRLARSHAVLGAPGERRGVHATVAWSWGLLDPLHQSALRQATVFAGGFDLEAAEAVLRLPDGAPPVIDVLQSLVDGCLARRRVDGRLDLYETVRQFLRDRPPGPEVETRHGAWYGALAVRLAEAVQYDARPLDELERELPNLRAVFDPDRRTDPRDKVRARLGVSAWMKVPGRVRRTLRGPGRCRRGVARARAVVPGPRARRPGCPLPGPVRGGPAAHRRGRVGGAGLRRSEPARPRAHPEDPVAADGPPAGRGSRSRGRGPLPAGDRRLPPGVARARDLGDGGGSVRHGAGRRI